ncbi:hypothetical protein [Cystobacter ferrugineus]|uniref:DUF3108 domain-containing protein n=1 Tax=Cystobacter ferrugineus TaxID=83449 RepID=A0A1L9BF71_9BACT|nr:hypothetical protein [Cystobacter ferrugineus]OJH40866.1 hypothetical protein BON30_08035 [Cystobacter ferrugineus]
MLHVLSASVLALTLQMGPGAPASPLPDAGTPADAGTPTVDASRLEEARAMVPAPLLYGKFRPEVGTFVEYDVTQKEGRVRVRASVVGRTEREAGPMFQVEFDYLDARPHSLVVLWLIGETHPMVDRLALAVEPNAPISIPVDLPADAPELRGKPGPDTEAQVKSGPFAGKAVRRTYRLEKGNSTEVMLSEKVPLFGVESVRGADGSTWVARKTGSGARPELRSVPIAIPRLPEQ